MLYIFGEFNVIFKFLFENKKVTLKKKAHRPLWILLYFSSNNFSGLICVYYSIIKKKALLSYFFSWIKIKNKLFDQVLNENDWQINNWTRHFYYYIKSYLQSIYLSIFQINIYLLLYKKITIIIVGYFFIVYYQVLIIKNLVTITT